MPTYQGQTDQVLKIKLPSAILNARWGANEVATGGDIMLEVNTQWVADGSEIEIRVKDFEGGPIETLQGKVFANIHRRQYLVSKANKTGGMFFEAELKAHGLKVLGPKVRVGPPLEIKDLKWLDEKGKDIGEISLGETAEMAVNIKGAFEGAMVYFALYCELDGPPRLFRTFETKVKEGKAGAFWEYTLPGGAERISIQRDLNKSGEKYQQPKFFFEVNCLGIKAKSPDLKILSWVEFDFGPVPEKGVQRTAVFEMPDGSEKKETVPEVGNLRIASSFPGQLIFKGFADG